MVTAKWSVCVGNFARSKSACGDYPDHVARFPSFTRLLSLWPGLRRGYRARQRSRWRDVQDIAEALERPSRHDVKADNEMSLRTHDKMGMERLGTFINDAVAFRFMA